MSDPVEPTVRLADPADPADLAAVGRLTVEAYLSDGLVDPHSPYAAVLEDAGARAADAELWVAELDGDIVGTVTFCPPGSSYREVSTDTEGEFRMLAVAPTARGRGVGRRLVERCVDRTRNLGLDELVLVSGAGMATAHRLYESMGFARDEALDWSPQPDVCLQGFRATVPPSPTPPRPSPAHGPGSGDGRRSPG